MDNLENIKDLIKEEVRSNLDKQRTDILLIFKTYVDNDPSLKNVVYLITKEYENKLLENNKIMLSKLQIQSENIIENIIKNSSNKFKNILDEQYKFEFENYKKKINKYTIATNIITITSSIGIFYLFKKFF
jgi:hypothetical protein